MDSGHLSLVRQSPIIDGIDLVAEEDKNTVTECFIEIINLHGITDDSDGPRELCVARRDNGLFYYLFSYGFDNTIYFGEMEKLIQHAHISSVFSDWFYDPQASKITPKFNYVGALVIVIQSKELQRGDNRANVMFTLSQKSRNDDCDDEEEDDYCPIDEEDGCQLSTFLESGVMSAFCVR